VSGVVSDTSPLIALHQIGQLGLLGTIFGSVLIPPAVAHEAPGIERPAWLLVRSLEKPLAPPVVGAGLGPGETEAISLALELRVARMILDDLPARVLAQKLGIPLIGTLGILLAAKRRGLISAIREPIDTLRAGGFRVATELYERVLTKAGELA
jgi:predicted nucleic acid-binding protein